MIENNEPPVFKLGMACGMAFNVGVVIARISHTHPNWHAWIVWGIGWLIAWSLAFGMFMVLKHFEDAHFPDNQRTDDDPNA